MLFFSGEGSSDEVTITSGAILEIMESLNGRRFDVKTRSTGFSDETSLALEASGLIGLPGPFLR